MIALFTLAAFLVGFVAIYNLLPAVIPAYVSLIFNPASGQFAQFGSYLQYMNLFAPVDVVINLMVFAFGMLAIRLFAKFVFYSIALLRGNSAPNSRI